MTANTQNQGSKSPVMDDKSKEARQDQTKKPGSAEKSNHGSSQKTDNR